MRFAGFLRWALPALALIVARPGVSAQQADRSRTEALARRAGERLQALQKEADRLAAEERTVLGDLRKLEIERQIKAEQLRGIEAEGRAIGEELRVNGDRMRLLQEKESATGPELRARLVEIYKLGQARYARLLLSTTDARQVAQATRLVAALAKLDRDRVLSHRQTLQELTRTRTELETRRNRLEAVQAEARRAQASVERAARARDDLIRDIDHRRDLTAQLVAELQAAQLKLQTTLRDLAAGLPAAPAALPLAPFRGDLPWPAAGSVVRRGRVGGDRAGPSSGIEISSAEGTSISAVHEGVVAFAAPFSGFGNLVIVNHGPRTFSLYGDLLDIAVQKDDRVDRGQAVGTSGATSAGMPGLYFELRVDGQSVDPLQWLRKR